MRLAHTLILSAAIMGMLVMPSSAQQPAAAAAAAPTRAEIDAMLVADLALANQTIAFGRGESDADAGVAVNKSPESLLSGAAMLLRVHKLTLGKYGKFEGQATDGSGKPITGAAETIDLSKQAEAVFEEARALVAGDRVRSAGLEAMIKEIKGRDYKGGVGGPRTVTRVLQPGETHSYPVAFISGQPAAVAMTSTGPPKIQFDLNHANGTSLLSIKGHNANYNWTPQRDKKDNIRKFTITLVNNGNKPTTYTLCTN